MKLSEFISEPSEKEAKTKNQKNKDKKGIKIQRDPISNLRFVYFLLFVSCDLRLFL